MPRFYQGKYTPKNKKKYRGNLEKIIYRSGWELQVFQWCDENKNVKSWNSEEVVIPYFYSVDNTQHRYFTDLLIEFASGDVYLVEIKPKKETKVPRKGTKNYLNEAKTYVKNQDKWTAAEKFAKKKNWTFVVWTEDTLKQLGIMKQERTARSIRKPAKSRPVRKRR